MKSYKIVIPMTGLSLRYCDFDHILGATISAIRGSPMMRKELRKPSRIGKNWKKYIFEMKSIEQRQQKRIINDNF